MPNIKSAKKRVKVNAARQELNKSQRSALRTSIKKADAAIEAKSPDMETAVKAAVKSIDVAASKGLLHKNTAANHKSKLVIRMNKAAK